MRRLIVFVLLSAATLAAQFGGEKSNTIPAGGGGITFVQSADNDKTTSTTTQTVGNGVGSGWSTGNVTNGNVVFVFGSGTNPGVTTATGVAVPTYTCANSSALSFNMFWCYGTATSTAAELVTITTTNNTAPVMVAIEVHGLTAKNIDQVASGNIGASASWTLPSITTLVANSIVIGCAGNNSTNNVYTNGAGYTFPPNAQASGGNQSAFCEYQIVSSTGTYAPTATLTSMAGSGLTLNLK